MTQVTQDAKAAIPGFVGHTTPITVDHAEGAWVYGTDGSKWLDFCMGIAVANTGHCHPKVVKAAQDQMGKMIHAQMNMYLQQPMMDLADTLCEIVPGNLDQVLFANSGAEAVENAVKLAKGTLRRPGVIAFQNAFHGRTHLAMALTDSVVHYRGHMQPLVPCVFHARYCDPYHTPAGLDPTEYAIEDLRRILRAEIYGEDVACIVVEPLQGEGGFVVPTPEFMHELRDRNVAVRLGSAVNSIERSETGSIVTRLADGRNVASRERCLYFVEGGFDLAAIGVGDRVMVVLQ